MEVITFSYLGRPLKGEPMPAAPAVKRLRIREVGGIFVVEFEDQILRDLTTIELVARELLDEVKSGKFKIVIHLGNVEATYVAFLNRLCTMKRLLHACKGGMVICSVRSEVMELFNTTKVDKEFKIVDTEKEALAEFGILQ